MWSSEPHTWVWNIIKFWTNKSDDYSKLHVHRYIDDKKWWPKYTYTPSESLWGKYTFKLVPRLYKDWSGLSRRNHLSILRGLLPAVSPHHWELTFLYETWIEQWHHKTNFSTISHPKQTKKQKLDKSCFVFLLVLVSFSLFVAQQSTTNLPQSTTKYKNSKFTHDSVILTPSVVWLGPQLSASWGRNEGVSWAEFSFGGSEKRKSTSKLILLLIEFSSWRFYDWNPCFLVGYRPGRL